MTQIPNRQNQQAPHPGFWRRTRIWTIAFVGVLAVLLALTACGVNTGGNLPPYSVPAQWHDASPPTAGTSEVDL
jgi:predicted small lipoprotein YifL